MSNIFLLIILISILMNVANFEWLASITFQPFWGLVECNNNAKKYFMTLKVILKVVQVGIRGLMAILCDAAPAGAQMKDLIYFKALLNNLVICKVNTIIGTE